MFWPTQVLTATLVLNLAEAEVDPRVHILRSIETSSRAHAELPFLSHRRGQHGCRGTHCEQTNEFHTLLFSYPPLLVRGLRRAFTSALLLLNDAHILRKDDVALSNRERHTQALRRRAGDAHIQHVRSRHARNQA